MSSSEDLHLTVENGDPQAYNEAVFALATTAASKLARVQHEPNIAEAIVREYTPEPTTEQTVSVRVGNLFNPTTEAKTRITEIAEAKTTTYYFEERYVGKGVMAAVRRMRHGMRHMVVAIDREGTAEVQSGNLHSAVSVETWHRDINGAHPVANKYFEGQSQQGRALRDKYWGRRPNKEELWHLKEQALEIAKLEQTDGAGVPMIDPNAAPDRSGYLRRQLGRGVTMAAIAGVLIGVGAANGKFEVPNTETVLNVVANAFDASYTQAAPGIPLQPLPPQQLG